MDISVMIRDQRISRKLLSKPTRHTLQADQENRAFGEKFEEAAAQDHTEQRLQKCVNLFPHIYNALRWSRGEEAVQKYETIKEVMDDFFGPAPFTEEEEEELVSRESVQEILDRFQELADRDARIRNQRVADNR
ncbi:Protein CBG04531 [Caenorhabditis briggsae]|uniref:Protein CBG04531 n=1 Tax=Caenorhabditis briggsae TaxID=6238 RepID=A8WXN6_CAEBR|nr:Protein CBG04531 [Caenorhabditis briggsae]CAP25169.2 Protein CBG04531 [Caenorhabditis briggsae]